MALNAGCPPRLISVNGVPKDEDHIRRSIRAGHLTNLTDLADGFVKGLWTHRWRSQHSPLEVWR